jgi:hypothetical protein
MNNLFTDHPDIANRLKVQLLKWQGALPVSDLDPMAGKWVYPWPKQSP